MDKLENFIEIDVKFDTCVSIKDTKKNESTQYEIIIKELEKLLMGISDVGDGN